MGRRVYVRAIGVVSSFGVGWHKTANALAEGRVAISRIEGFDTEGFPCRVAAQVPFVAAGPDRRCALTMQAAHDAFGDSGIKRTSKQRLGVFIGAESGRVSFSTLVALSRAAGGGDCFDRAAFAVEAQAFAPKMHASVLSACTSASSLAGKFGAEGPVRTVSLACASSLAAIGEATRALRLGLCELALAGGVGADVDPMMLAGFGLLGALSQRQVSRPFDHRRDGFVLGEGAALVLLSTEKGDAECEVAGVGRSLDAYRLTAPAPDGRGARHAMKSALADAGETGVDYVQAHGTSTPINDAVEASAVSDLLGAGPLVSSVKGALGHWVAGAGALGFLSGWEAVARSRILPTAGLSEPDARSQLSHVTPKAVERSVRTALVNSFAFGGANCALVLRRAS